MENIKVSKINDEKLLKEALKIRNTVFTIEKGVSESIANW